MRVCGKGGTRGEDGRGVRSHDDFFVVVDIVGLVAEENLMFFCFHPLLHQDLGAFVFVSVSSKCLGF